MIIKFAQRFKELRKAKNISQEAIAEMLGITSQAVSKWECEQSYPDIELLPVIADIFAITIDSLFRDDVNAENQSTLPFPDDDKIRLVRYKGHSLIVHNQNTNQNIRYKPQLGETQVEVWGDCTIEGDVIGNVVSNGNIECGDVAGNAYAGGNVDCGDVCGNVKAGGNVNCGEDIDERMLTHPAPDMQMNQAAHVLDSELSNQLRSQIESNVKEALKKVREAMDKL